MTVKEAIEKRRAYRSLEPVQITDTLIKTLAEAGRLAPSCYNNQPWRFIFVRDKNILEKMQTALSTGNAWAQRSSLIIVVFSTQEDDCIIKDREYYLFDTGLATAHMILRATELDLVAHPIAGYSPSKVKEILNIPEKAMVITLLVVGKRLISSGDEKIQDQIDGEQERPGRRDLEQIYSVNSYTKTLES